MEGASQLLDYLANLIETALRLLRIAAANPELSSTILAFSADEASLRDFKNFSCWASLFGGRELIACYQGKNCFQTNTASLKLT